MKKKYSILEKYLNIGLKKTYGKMKKKLEEEIENLNEKIIFVEKQKQFEQTIVQREKLEVRLSTLQADYLEVGKFVSEAKIWCTCN